MNPSVAVIGCGYWGKNLVRVFSELGALACVCDSDSDRLKSLSFSGTPPELTQSLDSVLANRHISATVVATPAATHYDVVRRCLEADKDVLVEKPLSLTVEHGAALVELARSRSKILMVGHILLYHPAVKKLREVIQKGELGKILYCYSSRLNMGLVRTEENVLWSFAPHDISVLLHLLGEEPVDVQAEGQSFLTPGVVDTCSSSLKFAGGATARVFVSWLHPTKEQRLVVVGSEKMAVFDDTAEKKLLLYPHRVDRSGAAPKAVKAEPVAVELEKLEPLKEECRHFLDCIAKRQTPQSDGAEGLRVLKVLDVCQKALDRSAAPPAAVSKPSTGYQAHPSAYIDEPCEIGDGTRIWHFSHIMKGAKIGQKCAIGQNVVISSKAVVGNGVKIQNNVSVYDEVILEDGVFCGPSMVFTNVINPRSEIIRKDEYRRTLIRRGATLGANCTIVCGHTVGRYAFVAAGATVARDVPDFALVAGVPAKQLGWMCQCAADRLKFDAAGRAVCSACKAEYRLDGNTVTQTAPGKS